MTLPPSFFKPFDLTYDDVTRGIQAHPLVGMDKFWMDALIRGFRNERDAWTNTPQLSQYWRECERLKLRLLHLVVAAYLHVSSDIRPIPGDFGAKIAPLTGSGNRKSYPLPV